MSSCLSQPDICNIPDSRNTLVFKDECIYCFDTPESQSGLYICMKYFIGVCENHLNLFHKKSNNRLFLNLKVQRRLKVDEKDNAMDTNETEYQKLVKEAFAHNKIDTLEFCSLFVMPEKIEILLSDEKVPANVQSSVQNILNADSLSKAATRAEKNDTFDPNCYKQISKYANSLIQLNNGVKVPPSGLKCCKCDLTSNLWMNLSDGTILCGRKFFDGTGGNNHAIEHYEATKYPLAVKLGTITPSSADVFSYPEDDMVVDNNLSNHLAHFGIDIMKMTKTEKTMEEIEMENIKNSKEKIAIMEIESNLEVLTGKELTGINNTGNSCYINSVLQVLFKIPDIIHFYSDRYESIIASSNVTNDSKDFRVQMGKVGWYLKSGDYSFLPVELEKKNNEIVKPSPGITPQIFRMIIGQNHTEFSTKQQQDVNEFLIHLFGLIEKDIKKNKDQGIRNPLESVVFQIEDRLSCETTKTVNYQSHDEYVLSLTIPLDEAVNKDEVSKYEQMIGNDGENKSIDQETVRPKVKLTACLQAFMRPNLIEDYTAPNRVKGQAYHSSRIRTFPEFLWIQLKRFTIGNDWMPKKLDVEIVVPDELDLSFLRAKGIQPGECPMPTEQVKNDTDVPELNSAMITELLSMGFHENACKKAVFYTGNASLEEAANWLMIHVGEDDFEQLPPELINKTDSSAPMTFKTDDLETMQNLGFTMKQSKRALTETQGSLERAVDWAFNHPQEINEAEQSVDCDKTVKPSFNYSDGEPKYELVGLISHMGNNSHVGHYVAHVKLEANKWVLFNDEKVQRSLNPPKQFAYMYLYRRMNIS